MVSQHINRHPYKVVEVSKNPRKLPIKERVVDRYYGGGTVVDGISVNISSMGYMCREFVSDY